MAVIKLMYYITKSNDFN